MLADHLAHQPVEDYHSLKFDFPDEDIMAIKYYYIPDPDEGPKPQERWTLMFDGTSNAMSYGIGAVMASPKNYHLTFITKLYFDCTDNIVEYETCMLGVEKAIDLRIKILEVYGDSALVIHHIKGD